jgi:uridine kinase
VSARNQLLWEVARAIEAKRGERVYRVGIDGVDGVGKTTFADELASRLDAPIIRASVDSFHNPRAVRYARGRESPEGFYRDSFDLGTLRAALLDPLSRRGEAPRYRIAAFDHRTDEPVDSPMQEAGPRTVLIFDGIFLHRPELRGYWDYSVFLHAERTETLRRCNEREGIPDASHDPSDPIHARYVKGQDIYLRECTPMARATVVIDNQDLAHPRILESPTSR